jgi:hypothetical protein
VVLRVSWVTGIFLGVWGGPGSVWEVTKKLIILVFFFGFLLWLALNYFHI